MLTTPEGEDETLIGQIADRISMRGKSQMTVEDIQDHKANELLVNSVRHDEVPGIHTITYNSEADKVLEEAE